MPSPVSDQQLGEAILESVEHGSFPQSEDVVSAPVPTASLPKLLEIVGRAREDTKNEVRKVSRESASDVDGWIAQARKLQDDIKRSQETAKEIVKQAESGKDNSARLQDAASKVSLLHSEIAYNESLAQVVEQVQDISTLLVSAQNAAVGGHVIHALERLEDAESAFKSLGPFETTRVVGVLKTRGEQLRAAIVENITDSWNELISVDLGQHQITIREQIEREAAVHIDTIVDALTKVNHLDDFISRLTRDFEKAIISPRLSINSDKVVSGLRIDGDSIQAFGNSDDMSVKGALEDIHMIAEYLSTRLPPGIAIPLSAKLFPKTSDRLISNWLLPAVPLSVTVVQNFQETLSFVMGLVEYLDELGWTGQHQLVEWVDKAAEIWLARQKQTAIAGVQTLLPKRVKEKKIVERVETQVIAQDDAMLAGQDQHDQEEHDDDWGAEWGDGDDDENAKEKEQEKPPEEEEEDMSAWGVEGDEEPAHGPRDEAKAENRAQTDEDDGEDWGAEWGDEEDTKATSPSDTKTKTMEKAKTNGIAGSVKHPAEKEITLRETYTVSAIPDSLIEIILQIVADVETLNTPELAQSTVAPASVGLYAIPSLLLAMYRATAALHYSKDIAGNMLIYNDCQRLSDRLRTFLQEQTEKDKTSNLPDHLRASTQLKPKLDADIKTIDVFGKRAYGREMESQRQIIRDHLDDAQGFQGCTNVPFASVCDDAIATTIDRIGEVKRQWQNVLSHSALLQSLGSLVSTALTKFINDVEDMPDIPAEESKKLHSYATSLSSLSSLFQTEDESGEMRDMTSIYTPNWFKFQYLGEILDSSLADIKYMWTDGELKLEMGAEEVVDLIKALFAESDYRRKAVADIRRLSM